MDWQAFTVQTIVFGTLFLFLQRADPTRKQAVRRFVWFMLALMTMYAWWYTAWMEMLWGFIVALVVNFLFWALIGRYNPAASSDDIRVLGMDD
jgi:hypothetical protein